MAKKKNKTADPGSRTGNNETGSDARTRDIQDSPRDEERLRPEETNIDLPDVKDIPGQEFIHVPRMGELADTTISSDDEEGVGLFSDDADEETRISMGTENDVSQTDKAMFENMDNLQGFEDDANLQRASLERTDFEGDALNENSDREGRDLDTSGVESDDAMENIGEEDEENNLYSKGSDKNDNMNEGTP